MNFVCAKEVILGIIGVQELFQLWSLLGRAFISKLSVTEGGVPLISYQLSVISYQLSVISYQLSVISYQLSVISYQLSKVPIRKISSKLALFLLLIAY
jgi:hypothetical protein